MEEEDLERNLPLFISFKKDLAGLPSIRRSSHFD